MPEGHGAMDKALARHAGDRSTNPIMTKDFSAPNHSSTPPRALSLVTCPSVNIHRGGKKREIVVKSKQRHLWAKHRYKSDVWDKGSKQYLFNAS